MWRSPLRAAQARVLSLTSSNGGGACLPRNRPPLCGVAWGDSHAHHAARSGVGARNGRHRTRGWFKRRAYPRGRPAPPCANSPRVATRRSPCSRAAGARLLFAANPLPFRAFGRNVPKQFSKARLSNGAWRAAGAAAGRAHSIDSMGRGNPRACGRGLSPAFKLRVQALQPVAARPAAIAA